MKLNRYIFSTVMLILILFLLINGQQKISKQKQSILKLSNKLIVLREKKSKLNKFIYMEIYHGEKTNKEKLKQFLNEIEQISKSDDIISDISFKIENRDNNNINLIEFNEKFDSFIAEIEKMRNFYISETNAIVFNRNILFLFLMVFSFASLFYEIIAINMANKKVSFYLKNLLYKNYNFEIKNTNIPYMDYILSEINTLKTSLKIMDNSIKTTLKGYNLKTTLQNLLNDEEFQSYLSFERIGFATIENDYFLADISLSTIDNIKLNRGFKIKRESSDSLMSLINNKEIRIINDLEKHFEKNPKSESTNLILKEGYLSSITAPLYKSNGKIIGILFFSSVKRNNYSEIDKYKISSITEIVSSIFEKNMLIEDLITNSALTFVKLVEGKDPETSNHLDRMAQYSKIIAKYLSYEEKYKDKIDYFYMDNLCKFAPLHDIGKVGIPDSILLKPGKLTDEEFQIMKEHPKIGAKVLNYYQNNLKKYDIDTFKIAVKITISHHEKWDGTGYPNGLKGEKIPLVGRITAVADVFDALSSKRIYKEAMSFDKSVSIIKEMSGTHFDPEVVEAFIKALSEIEKIYQELKAV